MRTSLAVVSVALCLGVLPLAALPQSPAQQPPPPTFRSGVDLLTLEASVRDRRGVPVPDLQPSDFTVTIDGRARKVVSAQFYKADTTSSGRVVAGAPPTPQHVTNDEVTPGRVVVFAVDGDSIERGQEKAMFDTAARMLDALSPSDAVGLVEIPGPTIDVTRDHAGIAETLKRFTGRRPPPAADLPMSFDEALAIERGDQRIFGMVVARECNKAATRCSPDNPGEVEAIRARVKSASKGILFTERNHAQQVVATLTTLLHQVEVVRAPRSVILISGGLGFDPENLSLYKDLERAAAEARVMLYTVRLGQLNFDMSNFQPGDNIAGDPALEAGLANISSMTNGLFFSGSGRATGIFNRIASEVTSIYQLGLESSPADADGKEHDIKIGVSRPDLDVRAPSHVSVPRPSTPAVPRDLLAVALLQPTDVPDVPLAITTYNTHGAGDDVQVLVSAEIGAPNSPAPAEWGLVVTQNGKKIITTRGRIPAGAERPRVMSTPVTLPPGAYQLRVAAVDVDDRTGVLEIPITVGFEAVGDARLSDLVVGVVNGGVLEPRRRLTQGDDITAVLAVWGAIPAELTGTLQLIPSGSAQSALNVPLAIRRGASPDAPAAVQVRAALAPVPPGRYTASAVLQAGGQPFARISRVVEIVQSPAGQIK